MWLKDTGLLTKLKNDAINLPKAIPLPRVRHNQPHILRQLGVTVIILAIGLFIAILAFLGEFWSNRKKTDVTDHFEMSEQTTSENGGCRELYLMPRKAF